ncbi:MAG: flagellar hook-length control protein FliK [Nitrospiraceae bacterium]|nr:flagellar hook-length control protein FliK [Nitrospiraceae bacterium]
MNINLFQMFAGPKMPQGMGGVAVSDSQTTQATGDFSGLLQSLLFGNIAGMQTTGAQQGSYAALTADADESSPATALQMMSDSLKDGILTQEELLSIIQTMLAQFPSMQNDFATKLGSLLSSLTPADQTGELALKLKAIIDEGLQAPSQPTGTDQSVGTTSVSQNQQSAVFVKELQDTAGNFDKTDLSKPESTSNKPSTSPKGLSAEEFVKQIAMKISEQKMQNPGAYMESPAKLALQQSAGEEIFGQLVSSVARSVEHGSDESGSDALKNVSDLKFTPAAASQGTNAPSAAASAKEVAPVSRINEIDQVIMKMANSGQQRLVLRIDPPDLGSIQIRITLDNGVIKADFRVDNQAAKDSFAFAMPQIKTSLEDAGIRTGEFFVDLKEDYYSDRKQGQDQPQQNKNGNRQKENSGFFELFA